MDDEIQRIILKVEGEDKVRQLSAAIAKEEDNLRSLIAAHGAQSAAARASADAIGRLNRQLQGAESQVRAAGGGSRNLAQGFLEVSRAAEDAQYGIAGVVNNIPGLVTSLGGGAGVVAAVSLAAVGVAQLVKHWDELAGLFGQGRVKTQAEEMEELRKKTSLTADETARLLKLETLRKNADAQSKGTPKEQADREEAVNRAIVEAPYADARKGVEAIEGERLRKAAPQELVDEKAAADAEVNWARLVQHGQNMHTAGKGDETLRAAEERQKKAQEALDADLNGKVTDFLAGLADPADLKGDKLRAFLDKATKDPSKFGPNASKVLGDLVMQLPENRVTDEDRAFVHRQEARAADRKARAEQSYNEIDSSNLREEEEMKKVSDEEMKEKAAEELFQRIERENASRKAEFDAGGAEATERKRREDLDKRVSGARQYAPTIDDAIRETLKGMGGSREGESALVGMLAPKFGVEAATKLVRDQGGAAREQLMADYMKGPERRSSSVIGAEGLASSIQAAVGKDSIAEKQLQVQQHSLDVLQRIARVGNGAGGGRIVARPDGSFGLG